VEGKNEREREVKGKNDGERNGNDKCEIDGEKERQKT